MTCIRRFILFFIVIVSVLSLSAQELSDYGFTPWTEPVVSANGINLRNAWAGGLNNVQAGKIDFNNDGINDLLLFDRHGDRLLPFIYNPAGLSPGFNYAPEYRRYFPALNHWFQLADYNNDGYPDIFTYTPGGIMVYRNKGELFPAFEKAVDPYITSLQGNIFTNLLVTNVDYPAISDLDGDGDLDILTFWGLGSFVEYHRNMSVELYGHRDSLVFHKVSNCWGRFAENTESNAISFDTCVDFTNLVRFGPPKHTGSTFLLTDITGNGVYDLVLGDVDFSNVVALRNAGNNAEAVMVEQLPPWPSADPVNLWSFPLVQKIDLYNDGTEQLIASPFDPGLLKSEGSNSVWLYSDCKRVAGVKDCGLLTRSFLQDGMIELGLGAYPVFSDVNGDGLTDLVVGNYGLHDTCVLSVQGQLKCYYTGRLYLYLNNGSPGNPSFILSDDDFGFVSQLGLTGVYPAFSDLDGDGDNDMLLGNSEGGLWMFRNEAGPGQVPVFDIPVPDFQNLEVGDFCTPAFVDINVDGLNDLVTGGISGKLSYFENQGSIEEPGFVLISNNFGSVNVTDPEVSYTGYSVPCFFRTAGGELRLLAGSESGLLKYYKDINDETGHDFTLSDPHFMYITEGIRTSPAWADLNNDGFPDLAIGNYSGGITLFKGESPGPAGITNFERPRVDLSVFPNPGNGRVKVYINSPGTWQVMVYTLQGRLLSSMMIKGRTDNEFFIAGHYSGFIIVEAKNPDTPSLILRKKAVIIR
ncbi:MAG: FG-GAP repeat domain-containing protein [Lentimicrobium sp.]